jgi:hypothetical protein
MVKQNNIQLPNEIFQLIVNHVGSFDYETRQQTMLSLSAASITLKSLAEPHIYTHPRDLDMMKRQWQFAFTLAAEPYLGSLVRSLQVLWLSTGENGKLLVDIARACLNNQKLLLQRGHGPEDSNTILKEDVLNMAALLDASPLVTDFFYSTYLKWSPEQSRYGEASMEEMLALCQGEARFAKFAAQLAQLTLHGQVQWLLQALTPHLSSNLASLTLGQDTELPLDPPFFMELARQSPHLEELEVRCLVAEFIDLADACKIWGSTLRVLRLSDVWNSTEGIPQVVSSLLELRELSLGPGCWITIRDFGAIIKSFPDHRLTLVSLSDLEDPEEAVYVDASKIELDDHLVQLIRSHSSTLEHLQINMGHEPRVGRRVLHSCKEARRLESLYVLPTADVKPSDVDHLLQTCFKLSEIPKGLQNCSAFPREWEGRALAKEKREEEELMREGPLPGLGS